MGIVYCIECLETGEKYIGSTKQTLKERVYKHRHEAKNKRRCSSKQILDRGNYTSYSLEDVEDEGKLLEREQHHMDETECINGHRAVADKEMAIAYKKIYMKSYREENSEKLRIQDREYREKNRDKIKAKSREKIKCECGAVISRGNVYEHRKSKRHLLGIEDLKETVL